MTRARWSFYPYLRSYPLRAAVLMDVPVPGVDPWDELMRNPHVWHFAFHATPGLPEQLIQGRQREYFDFFYNAFSRNPALITDEARSAYVDAYTSGEALTAGFSWYRTIPADAIANRQSSRETPTDTPVLLLLAEASGAMIETYADGYRHAGLAALEHAVISGVGHFIQEEAPNELWQQILNFARL